ncbi:acyltransferase [Winogradskyella flava]|uniref:acyltransferase n=1 Tax=Winogradskyella flava TaxID=1884876 RepID=UPI0024938A14|nr:hypothetical protein [Winogradskyella flava]
MKKTLTFILCLFLPSFLLRPLLRILGYRIGRAVRIGFSIIYVNELKISDNSTIGHFNLLFNKSISLDKSSKIGYLNILKGPFGLILKERAAIGNKNYLTRANLGVSYGQSNLELGILTKITTGHHLDLSRSILFGDYSILAGIKSQIWTHGYFHAESGPERIRIDGEIIIGNNVYIGSGCIFNPGLKIADSIHLGAGSVISKNIEKPGMYVNQGLRFIPNSLEKVKTKLRRVEVENLVEDVYHK